VLLRFRFNKAIRDEKVVGVFVHFSLLD
jgi:hypothetical protein